MWSGDIVAERFLLERPVGSGGEGTVFLAQDRAEGTRVAVKLLDRSWEEALERFRREARVLATLTHPGIVRYVTHGEERSGQPFLVMEWLEGETLSQRLARGALVAEEAMEITRNAAEALGFAHARGVVHRDIKPSNLFLVDGNATRLKILDFGLARPHGLSQALTHSGAILGTVGYMAPEQAMGSDSIDARADIFGLGCVLYECVTGRRPFAAEHAVAVLAKLLHADAVRVSELRPELGEWLDALLSRMMAKKADDRPATVQQLLEELEVARTRGASASRTPSAKTPSLTHAEQRIVSVILMEPEQLVPKSSAATPESSRSEGERIRAVVRQFGAEPMPLTAGSWLVVLSGRGAATDRATLAGACALSLQRNRPGSRIAVATGRADTTGRLPVGPAIDRAAALLRASRPSDLPAGVDIDDGTARLLGPHFDVRQNGAAFVLRSERPEMRAPRLLLGKPTPCVGRQKELAMLDAILEECLAERVARVALVVGPAGIGKSRLRTEFLNAATRRNVAIISAYGDQTLTGSSFSFARQLVRSGAQLSDRDPPEVQQSKIRKKLAGRLAEEDVERLTEFLAELVLANTDEHASPVLRAARNDARIMATWLRRAFEEWLLAECAWAPVVLGLEDLHWADSASIALVSAALRKVQDAPLMVLAFARPEVHDALPQFASGLTLQEIPLAGLTRRPAQRLVEFVLGNDVSAEVATRIVNQADGNAFYLEELIRAVADGRLTELPETVVAMAQQRLEALPPDARRILRAAAIFGDVFSEPAVAALLGTSFSHGELAEWLRTLVELELLIPMQDGRFSEDPAHAFRHAFLREAAYAMLTDDDRQNGHRLAAEWLVANDEKDALLVAEHFERGGRQKEALPWLLRAAETALNAGNNELAMQLAERGLLSAEGELRGRFLETQQITLAFRGSWSEAFDVAEAAMALLPPGSTPWFRSAGTRIVCAIYLGRPSAVMEVLRVGASLPAPNPTGPFGLAMQMIIASLLHAGARAVALPFARRIDEAAGNDSIVDPVFNGWRHTVHATLELFLHDRIAPAIKHTNEALRSFDSAADFVGWSMASLYKGIAHVEAGAFETARTLLAPVAGRTEALLLPAVDFAKYYLARMDAVLGLTESSEALLESPPGIADGARAFLAEAHLKNGDVSRALEQANAAAKSASCYARATALSVLARIQLGRKDPAEAVRLVEEALNDQDHGSIVPFWRSTLLLARAEALMAQGQTASALEAIELARGRLLRIANDFEDPDMRSTYLRLPVHALTLERAGSWLQR